MAKKEIDKKALNAEISKAMMNDFERVGMGFVTYWKLIACAAVGLAVLIAAICWAASYQRSSAKNAREALSGARTADELAAALASYGSSPAAPAAHFRLAGLYLQDKKFDKALEELKLAEGGSDRIRPAISQSPRGTCWSFPASLTTRRRNSPPPPATPRSPLRCAPRHGSPRGGFTRSRNSSTSPSPSWSAAGSPGRYAERHRHLG